MKDHDKAHQENFFKPVPFSGGFYFLASLAIIIIALSQLSSFFTSIAVALLIWFLINAIANQLKALPFMQNKIGANLAIPLTLVLMVIILLHAGGFIALSIADLGNSLDGVDDKINAWITSLSSMVGIDLSTKGMETVLSDFSISKVVNSILGALNSIVGNISQIFLYVLFLLLDQRFFKHKLEILFPRAHHRDKAQTILKRISSDLHTYIGIMMMVSAGTGFLTYLICEIIGLEGAGVWGALAFILNFIPTIGSIVAVLIPAIFAFLQLPDLSQAVLLVACLGVVQFALGNVLQPRLMGDRLNISQFVVIVSLFGWGMMWGTVGMFLSVPIMVSLLIIFSQFENTRPLAILLSGDGRIPAKTQRQDNEQQDSRTD